MPICASNYLANRVYATIGSSSKLRPQVGKPEPLECVLQLLLNGSHPCLAL